MVSFDNRSAHTFPRQLKNLLQFSSGIKSFETVSSSIGDQKAFFTLSFIKGNPMGIIQELVPFTSTTKMIDQFTFTVIVKDMLSAIAIGNKDIAIIIDCSFRWYKFLFFMVKPNS